MFLPQRTPLLAILTALIFTLTTTSLPHHSQERKPYPKTTRSSDSPFDISTLTVPLTNGTATLPSPSGTLKAITLGLGTQNYTCNETTPSPVQVGAKAVLFDLSPFLPWLSPFLPLVPQKAMATDPEVIKGAADILGNHIFNALGVPCFHLGKEGDLAAKKVPGAELDMENAVPWLKLVDAGGSEGVDQVYRVNTVGGKPAKTCAQAGDIEVPYAALYYFYE
ncbi:uncharacterized protein KY384_006125 [Bacidia gigantensis]|uniref:uncharacterized protein n=1 Tax=Bacidia gigantensis TaxID=2732470 RepID=UPI001D0424F5|nr:uncharacterized protein KY384_006125 [Bacidia gigantensis]KAG8529488.1 hypothetical protein KY384_006125 [Bacidia gigantensis]